MASAASTYVVPQVLVFQEFNLIPQANLQQLCAHIAGGHAWLVRHSQTQEIEIGRLTWTESDGHGGIIPHAFYDPNSAHVYDWPQRPAGATLDPDYTKVFVDNAILQYFADYIGSGSLIQTVAGTHNQVRSQTLSFCANGVNWPRSTGVFYDRDVQLGDIAHVRAVVSGVNYDLWTYVAGFAGEAAASSIGAATLDSNNQSYRAEMTPIVTQTPGTPINALTISHVDASEYDGSVTGDLIETYTIKVIQSSQDRELQTALLRITSASGNDDQTSLVPAGYNISFPIGERGVFVTFSDKTGAAKAAGSLSAEQEDVAPVDLIVGQQWTVEVGQAWGINIGGNKPTQCVSDQGATYFGDTDCTYIVEVTQGGLWQDPVTGAILQGVNPPTISVTTDKGSDMSGSIEVPFLSGNRSQTVPIGTENVTAYFEGTGLCKGDVFYIKVKAKSYGSQQTLILGHSFPTAIQAASDALAVFDAYGNPDVTQGVEIDLELYIPETSLQIPSQRRLNTSDAIFNWTQTALEITINDGMVAYDSTWTDNGVAMPLPVMSNEALGYTKLYVEYRAWRSELCNDVASIYDEGQLDTYISGALDPDNPLKWAVYKALQNNNGVPVLFTSVCNTADEESWLNVLELLDGNDQVYGLVPLTKDPVVLNAWQGHVSDQSTPEMGRWRVAWFNGTSATEQAIVSPATSTDKGTVMATIIQNPLAAETEYTMVRVAPTTQGLTNGQFITNGVQAGDIVRFSYSTDQYGDTTYTEYVVDSVVNQDTLILRFGPDRAYADVALRVEVWRNLTADAQAALIGQQAGAWDNRRVRFVWPDEIGDGGTMMEGYHLCAALAALSGGVVSQQGLTRLAISGFDDLSHTTSWFNRSQLNVIAGDGVWIVTQDAAGNVFTRHAVTTGPTDDINQREEMVTRNVDAISYYFFSVFDPYIGISNVTPSLMALLRAELMSAITFLKSNNYVTRIGSQLIDATITDLRPHAVLLDRIVVVLSLTIPYALNNIEIHLVV